MFGINSVSTTENTDAKSIMDIPIGMTGISSGMGTHNQNNSGGAGGGGSIGGDSGVGAGGIMIIEAG
jgi:hypothetical protein